ncbi:Vitamin B12-binding protein [Fundidesulfovibrio magnetotacticus]|uniref:Vitamin B12-binding protein n=1 Tax=Fundidesulfovibrio magnetotacticus TaxID=2730080 RepID=A0A6V8LYL3_9BACT|nr:ABC transporter substrate-binding protein [Fundidesulfovibrio magnetotacticus]GFK94737.1 Vitamin B12-binding protein [Fundidesulfovibrio magnetotacticus]
MSLRFAALRAALPLAALLLALVAPRVHAQASPRIVSLYAAHAENLAAMGAAGLLAGVSEPLGDVPVVGARDGAEAIMALRPDIVLARPMHRNTQPGLLEQLERLGTRVVCLQPSTLAELVPYWLELGRLAGREGEARAMARRFDDELTLLREQAAGIPPHKRKGVFFEAIHRQMKTVSPDSLAAFVLESAGGVNLAGDAQPVAGSNIAHFGLERVVALGDSLEVYVAQKGPMNPVSEREIRETPGLASLKAVREGRVALVDETLVSRPTPRLLEGVRAVAAALYPERAGQGGGS